MKKIIISLSFIMMTIISFTQEITGDWYGVLKLGDAQLSIIFHINEADGQYSATLDSPDQGAKGIPADETIVEGNELVISVKAAAMTYKGKFDKQSNQIKGEFKQGGRSVFLDLSKEEVEKEITRRYQEPKDYPYHVEDVSILNKKADVVLAGTLTLPKDQKIKRAVILISGSGAQDRDANLGPMNHRPFLVWSDYMTINGIAVLRYDDRGTAKSTGSFQGSTSADFANDAEAALNYLKSREDMKDVEIGLMGHSEGGMIAPMVAARNKDVDFAVLLAGPGVSIDELLLKQKYDIAKAAGFGEDFLQTDQENGKAAFGYMKENLDLNDAEFEEGLRKIVTENVKGYPKFIKGGKSDEEIIKTEMTQYLNPWFKYFITYNPEKNLIGTQCPVLAVNGTLDLQVSNDENLAAIEAAMKKGGNDHYKILSYQHLNHLFQKAETGSLAEYGTIEETVNEEVLKDVTEWIKVHH